jgi:hypothetical protein
LHGKALSDDAGGGAAAAVAAAGEAASDWRMLVVAGLVSAFQNGVIPSVLSYAAAPYSGAPGFTIGNGY